MRSLQKSSHQAARETSLTRTYNTLTVVQGIKLSSVEYHYVQEKPADRDCKREYRKLMLGWPGVLFTVKYEWRL